MTKDYHEEDFICKYCLEPTKGNYYATSEDGDYPQQCLNCKVGYCQTCHTRLKLKSKYCIGCGAIRPTVVSYFVKASRISCYSMKENWHNNGLPEGQQFKYEIWHGINSNKLRKTSIKNYKDSEVIRELTEEEIEKLR